MKKKYLYNGEYYTEAEMTDFAKQSGVSFDSYIAALGKDVKVLDAPYEYKGNFYTQDEISAAAKKKGINDDAYLSQNGIKKKEEAYTGGAMSSAASKIGGQVGNFVGQSEKDNALSLIQSINAGITKGIEKGKQQFPNEIRATPEEEAALRDAQRRTGQADGLFTQQGAEQFNLLATDPLRAILDPEREKLQTAYNNRRLQGVRQTSDNTIARNNIDPNKTVQKKDGKLIPDVSSNPEYQVKNQEQALENVSGLVKNKFFKNGKEALEYAENQVKSGIDPTGNETIEHAITKAGEYKQKEESALNGKSIIQNAIEIQLQNDPLFKKQYETIINGTASDAEIADVARRFNIPLDKLKTQGSLPQEVVGELVHRFISDPDIKQIAEDNPEFKKDFDNFTGDKIYEVFPEYADVYIKNTLSRARELDGKNNWFANPIFDKSKYMDNLAEEVFKDRPILLKRVKDKFHNNWEHKIETTGIVDDLATGARGAMSGMWRSLKDVSGFGESYSDRIRNTLKEQYGHVETPHQNEFRKVVGEASNFMGMVLAMGATGSGLGNIGKGLGVMNPSVASKAVTLATFFDDELNHAASIYPENPTKAYLRASLSTAFFLVAGDAIPASKITGFKQNITQTLKSLETKALDKQAKMKLRDKILSVATETLQGTAKGTAEMTVMINGFKLLIDRALGLDESSINNEYSDANLLATAKSMLFGLPVPSMIHGFKGINRTRAAIYEMASNPEKYKSAILKRFGSDDHRIADIDFIADFKKYLDSMRVAENEKAKMVFNALHAKRLREQKSPDAFMKRNHEEEIRAIEQEQQDIMDGKDSDAGLTDSQKAIKTAYENGEINEMMEAQIKEALKDPAKADQFIKEIAEQATGAVAPELGNAKDGAIKFFGETLTDFAIGKSGKKDGGESVVFEYENEGEVPQKLKPLMVKDENGRITITMPKDEADALQKRIAEGLEPDMELMDGTLVKKTSTTEPVSPIPTEQAEALGEQVKARMGDQVSEGTNKEALEYAMEKVAEAPIEARKQLGDELFEKVLEATPTEKLQEGLDFLIDKNSDDPNVKELDRIISEREKKGSTPEQKSDWQKEQEAIDNDNTLSEAEKEKKKIESTAKALEELSYEEWEKVYNEVNTADKVIAAKQYFNAKETPEAERTDNQERLIKAVEELLAPKTQSKEQPTTAANETPQSSVEGAANPALRDVESEKKQIEDFGVAKEDVEATHGLLGRVFDGLKKAGLTAAKNVGEWVGIGKGTEKPYSLKIDGKDTQVKNVQPEVVNGFYSPLEKIITESKFDKLPAKQWAEKYANSEEAKWTGLKDWLAKQQGSVSKADIQNYLKDNRIEVVEVVNSGKSEKYNQLVEEQKNASRELDILESDSDNWSDENYKESRDKKYELNDKIKELSNKIKEEESKTKDTKFENYQLEGEKENYREVLVTMPNDTKGYYALRKEFSDYSANKVPRKSGEDIVAYQDRYKKELENDKDYQALRQRMIDADKKQKEDFKSSHFDEPNILVHLRMSDRIDSEGNKVLHLSEIQSDWGQKGKKEGFNIPAKKNEFRKEKQSDGSWVVKDANNTAWWHGSTEERADAVINEYNTRETRIPKEVGAIPNAPFVTDTNQWVKLGLKTALKYAVKSGATKITWETGETQNARYDLSKQVDEISTKKYPDGTYTIIGYKDGNSVLEHNDVPENKLEEYVGKDLAKKISDKHNEEVSFRKGAIKEFQDFQNELQDSYGKAEVRTLESYLRHPNNENSAESKKYFTLMTEAKKEYEGINKNDVWNSFSGVDLKVGGKGMKGFYGSPTEGSLGIVGNVAKSLFKQEPKTVEIKTPTEFSDRWEVKKYGDKWALLSTEDDKTTNGVFDTRKEADDFYKKQFGESSTSTQHSIDITPELKASVENGQPLFKDAEAQYRIESGKNIVEAIKDFNGSPRATVALTHEIMHPTVVAIIDGAKEGNEVGAKHTKTIVDEYNKANPDKKITLEQMIEGNDAFINGRTTPEYRAVQEFIAEAWEKYHHEGAKGFSKAFQEVLDAITEVFRQVYKSLTGTTLTPELRKMFDELLGKENVSEVVKAPEISSKAKNKFSNLREKIKQKQSLKIVSDEAENRHANSKLTETDNPVQEPNVKTIESEGENAKNATQAENVIIKIDSIISAATDVGLRKVSDISTDEKRFQGRDNLNAEKVQEIAENWNDADQDPIHVWTDPKDGKTYVLSGHHRLAAAKQAGREKVKVIDRSKDFTEEQAIRFAKEEANANRTMETAIERANTLRQKRERGDTKDDINKFLDREGKNKNFVNNLSRLNPKGKTIEALRATEKSDDKVTQKEVEKIADWIGEARDRNKNLTDAHENELFDFLMDREGSKRITTKQDFLSKVNSLAGAMDFNANEPLNIARYKHKTEGEKLYDKEVETQKGKISDLQQRINEINDRIKNPNNPQYLNPDSKDYEEIKKNADNKLSELNTELQAESKALLDLYQQKGKFARQGTEQSSLFSTEKNETELPEDYYNDLRDIIKDLKDEHKGITLDEIKEIAKSELGEYYSEPDIEAAYKMTEPQPPKSAPETPKSAPSRPDKSVLTNIVNAENTPPEVKKKLTAYGLKYDPESHDEALQVARAVIDSLGIDAAVTQARARNFGGAVNTFIQTEALNALYKKEAQAKTAQEKYEAAEKFADISIALDEWERGDAGRGISALATFYKKSPLGMVLKENKSRKEEFNQWAKGKEESWDEFLERLNKTPEFSDYVSEKVQTELKEERKKERSKFFKKVDDTLDKWINDLESGNVAFSSVVPPKLIAEALKGVKAAFKVGESATKIIGDAIDYISENIGDNWDKDTFRAKIEKALNLRAEKTSVDRYADRLKKQIEELQKQIDAGKRAEKERKNKKEYSDEEKELQEELKAKKAELEALSPLKNTESYKLAELDKFREKLKGLSEAEKDEVVSKAYKKLLDNGALDHADLREIIAKATGRGNLTEKQAARLQDLNETINTAEIAKQKHLKERTEQTLKDYHKAIDMAAKAKRDLANEFDKKTDYLKVLSSSIQGNTLGLLNVAVMNPLYNITTHLALRLPIGTVQSLLGLALGKAEMNTVFGKPMQAEFFGKGGRGFREAFKGLLTGMNRADYESKEIFSSQIRPNRSLRALLGKDNREDKMRWQEKLFHTFSVFPGATAETVFRLLNFGDKPMRYSASAATAAAFAKKYGIKFNTMDWKTFMEFPREIVKEMELAKGKSEKEAEQEAENVVRSIEKEGERSTMQQDNLFSDMLEKIFSGGKHEGAKSLAKTLTISPFVKIPSNVLWLGYNLVHPQIALAQAAAHTIRSYGYRGKGEIAESKLQMREARYWMSVTMMGAALQAVMIPLIKAGIITAANDEDDSKKKRIADLTYQPQGMFNMTKFWAYLSGKNVNEVQGGFEIPLKYFGLPGALGNSLARDYKQLTPEQKENRRLLTDNLLELFDADDFKDIENGIFSSSSSLLQGLKGGDMTYYAGNMVNLFTNLIQPAAVSEFSRAAIPYRISGKFDSLGDKIKNDLSNRSALFRKLTGKYPKGKRNIWGEIIKKDDSYANRYFGFNNVTKDNFAQFIYEDAQKWDDEDFLPPTVSNSLGGKKLTAEQLDELEENIGLARKEFIRAYTNDIALIEELGKNYSDILGRDAKKAALQYLYQKGRKLGVDMFVSKHPEFENVVSEEEKQVEELLKNFKEINLISEDEINEKIKH